MKHTAWFAVAALMIVAGLTPVESQTAGGGALRAMEQWPHWRGPLATGEAPHGDPPGPAVHPGFRPVGLVTRFDTAFRARSWRSFFVRIER